ncbi:MAG: hypothetical protein CENE_00762 [Candidatus Celerinatantimonas neptuna]|nr:MAG: hypothetical protein CENE_00762 [Candidatus Celerinatantimonas neptuna]
MILWTNFLTLFLTAAPWLLFGYLLAALIKYLLPENFLARHLGDKRILTTVKAALIGAPLPLCSCGVLPAAMGLHRSGASKSATTAFLVATPETGVDSVAISYALLGPVMAVARPIAAIFSAILAGVLVGCEKLTGMTQPHISQIMGLSKEQSDMGAFSAIKSSSSYAHFNASGREASDCCSSPACQQTSQSSSSQDDCCKSDKTCHDSCCDLPVTNKWRNMANFAFNTLIGDTYRWLIFGLILAAVIQTFVPGSWLTHWGQGFPAMLVMALIGVPMYICATGSTPLAAGFLIAGVSPGAVLVFLLAGPATNIATLMLVRQELGGRVLICYLSGVIGGALIFGWGLDHLLGYFHWEAVPILSGDDPLLMSWPVILCGVLLAVLMIRSLLKDCRNMLSV